MKVFSEKKNRYFSVTHELINKAVKDGGISEKEVNEKLINNGFVDYNWDFSQALVGGKNNKFEDIKLFVNNNGKYNPVFDSPIYTRLTAIELDWLAFILDNANIELFLSEDIIVKLRAKIKNRKSLFDGQWHSSKNQSVTTEYTQETRNNIKMIIAAITENKIIECKNETLYGEVFDNSKVIPYKIEYSLRLKAYWLIGYSIKNKKMVKMAIERMKIYGLMENGEITDLQKEIKLQRNTEPLKIEIFDEKGVLERALHSFSGYKKDGVFDRENNIHRLSIYYYEFDEYELIKDIIALGSYVRVISPLSIKEKILGKVKQQISMFA